MNKYLKIGVLSCFIVFLHNSLASASAGCQQNIYGGYTCTDTINNKVLQSSTNSVVSSSIRYTPGLPIPYLVDFACKKTDVYNVWTTTTYRYYNAQWVQTGAIYNSSPITQQTSSSLFIRSYSSSIPDLPCG